MRRLFLVAAICAFLIPPVLASQGAPPPKASQATKKSAPAAMKNQDVVKMVTSKLSEDIVIQAIRRARKVAFDLSPDGLVMLKNAGVSDAILAAMMSAEEAADGSGTSATALAPAPHPTVPTRPSVPDRDLPPSRAAASPASPIDVQLHDGAVVKVALTKALTTETAKLGEVVHLEVADDVMIDGHAVIKKGADATGKVVLAVKQLLTRGGKLEVSVESVEAVNGKDVKVKGSRKADGGRGLVRGNEAIMDADTEFEVAIDGEQTLALAPPPAPAVASRRGTEPAVKMANNTMAGAAADPAVPHDPGIYVDTGDTASHDLVPLEPTSFRQGKTGNAFGAAMTGGIVKMHFIAVVMGRKADLRIHSGQPVFYFYFENKASGLSNTGMGGWLSGASSPNEFMLARLTPEEKTRELKVGEVGIAGGSMGPDPEAAVDMKSERLAPGIYRVTPRRRLEPGEYCLFYPGGVQVGAVSGKLFDFGIDAR